MKAILLNIITTVTIIGLSSCSCAFEHLSLKATRGGRITSSSFQAAAKDVGFNAGSADSLSFRKRGVSLSYAPNGIIVIYSSFCPTPLTLLIWGADARAWEARCRQTETSLISWYAQRGIELRRTKPFPPEDVQQAASLNEP